MPMPTKFRRSRTGRISTVASELHSKSDIEAPLLSTVLGSEPSSSQALQTKDEGKCSIVSPTRNQGCIKVAIFRYARRTPNKPGLRERQAAAAAAMRLYQFP